MSVKRNVLAREIASFQRSRVMTNARTSWFVANDSAGVAAESAEESQRKIILYADNDDLRNRRRQPAARRIRARRLAKQQARRLAKQQARHLAKQQARRLAKPQTRLWMRRISAVHHTKPYRALLIYLPFCLMVFLLQPDLVFSKGGGGVTSSTSGGGYYGGGGGASSSSSTRWVFWYTGNGSRTCGNYCIITFSVIGAVILAIILCGVYRCVRICRDSKNRDLESNFNFEKRQPYIYSAPPNDLYAPLPSTSPTVQNTSLPPDYETTPPAPEAIHLSGKYRDAPTFEADAAEEYTRSYPPKNDLPPAEHREYIRNQGGVRAWQMTANPNRGVQVTDHGRTVCFSAKNDAMVQANYPMFTPEDKPKIDTTAHFKRDHDQPSSPAIVESAAPPYSFNNGPFAAGGSLANDELDSFKRRSRSVDDDSDVGLEAVGLYYYFEITVKEKPNRRNTAIAIGLSTKPYPEFRLPGWNKHSVAYHSDDGRKFCDDSKGGRNYSKEWRRVGDTVGCGYNPNTGYVFFTKNGKFMGIAFTGQCHVFFPTVGADGPCTVEVNFGDREFTFEKARGHSVAVAR